MSSTGSFEDLNGELRITAKQGSCSRHGVNGGRVLRVDLIRRVVSPLHVSPTTDLQTELAMMGSLGSYPVKLGKIAFLAVGADKSLPLRTIWDG